MVARGAAGKSGARPRVRPPSDHILHLEGTIMMQLQSPSFRDGAWIPRQHTAAGETLSPPLAWTELPRGARSLTLLLENLDLPSPARHGMPFLHWAVYDLQPSLPGLELGAN